MKYITVETGISPLFDHYVSEDYDDLLVDTLYLAIYTSYRISQECIGREFPSLRMLNKKFNMSSYKQLLPIRGADNQGTWLLTVWNKKSEQEFREEQLKSSFQSNYEVV